MRTFLFVLILLAAIGAETASAGEKVVVYLRDLSDTELKSQGLEIRVPLDVHVKALGGGKSRGLSGSESGMFAYGWIINADTRQLVWKMTPENSWRAGDDRGFDGMVHLEPGSYEVYFTAYAFAYRSMFSTIVTNVDHRQSPLFGSPGHSRGFFSWFSNWFANDISKEWYKRSRGWGIDLGVDQSQANNVGLFTPPKEPANLVLSAIRMDDDQLIRRGFTLTEQTTLTIDAIGEEVSDRLMADYGWIVNTADRKRVWEMNPDNVDYAGGAQKNIRFFNNVTLPKGEYVLYYRTDDSHSAADFNDAPPDDPLHWGIEISTKNPRAFKSTNYDEDANLIVSITRVGDNEEKSQGFTLNEDTFVRVYSFGERSNSRRLMADYGMILDAKTRAKVWTMDIDRTQYAGGAEKNRYIDEIVPFRRGSYIVVYKTDDSHAYGDWNDDPPFDPDHYGISVMGAGPRFKGSVVGKYVEERSKNMIAKIAPVGDSADRSEYFRLDRTTRVRVYAIGEGQDREMFDYGWIEDARTGNVVWEMTYAMTFYAGGGRKNRMVNTTIVLDRGEYRLRYRSDDSHAYGDWNVDPPEDEQFYGITLYKDEGRETPPVPPVPPAPSMPLEDAE